jgi:alkanesulfonate monooxygenase SsuD/methylene tetrahydromethanopterin reductase-like flavin-dependent oxidoreductase (luciferase family)
MMEVGVYSFGHQARRPDGSLASTSQSIADLMEGVRLADEVGLDFFGFGEHHTLSMPVSAPVTLLAAAGAATSQIRLGSTASVLGTDDPVRGYQQAATGSAVSGGRVDLTVGRGSSIDSFPLFGYDVADYDRLFAEKLDLLLAVNANERVTWSGTTRPSLQNALVVPRVEGGLKIWLGTGGNPGSCVRASVLGVPLAFGILSGSTEDWVGRADLYREAAAQSGHGRDQLDIAVASHGFVAADGADAKRRYFEYESEAFAAYAAEHGSPSVRGRSRTAFDVDAAPGGMIFAGGPDEIADRLVDFHQHLGHSRHILQMDLGHITQAEWLEAIELLGTKVAPQVRSATLVSEASPL